MREKIYIYKRFIKAFIQSILFYIFRIFPIQKNKIVFCCIEGSTGYSCNPKYIAEELLRRNVKVKLVWLVNDIKKIFPRKIIVVHNSLLNRAYQLTTAAVWIDNSRKQLEVRKRKNQLYLQTWHAKLGFKPTGFDRGKSFSKIAYYVSRHDSSMIDYILSNSSWYDRTLPRGMLYNGAVLRTGSPRCDILVNKSKEMHIDVRKRYNLAQDTKIVMYAPTFRGGSQSIGRKLKKSNHMSYSLLFDSLKKKFGGDWVIFLRLHPQLTVRNVKVNDYSNKRIIDVSNADDMYQILSGCDVFITDYSSAAFDAAVMRIPIFLYVPDYDEYIKERGKLLWNLKKLPFPLAINNKELETQMNEFNYKIYKQKLNKLFDSNEILEDGRASKRVVDFIVSKINASNTIII